MTTRVRPFRADDAATLSALFHAAVHQLACRDYTPVQLMAWSPDAPDPQRYIERAADRRLTMVAVDGADRAIAYGDIEPDGHIDHLYCHPSAAGSGVTIAVYDALERHGAAQGLETLFVEASEPARRFFERCGFATVDRRDFEIAGVAIHNYRMMKRLRA